MREDAAGSCTPGRAKAVEWKGIMEWAGMRSRLGQASRLSALPANLYITSHHPIIAIHVPILTDSLLRRHHIELRMLEMMIMRGRTGRSIASGGSPEPALKARLRCILRAQLFCGFD
jgi:hypothetical protein